MSARPLRLCIVTPAHWQAAMGGAQYQIECLLGALIPLQRYDISYVARRMPEGLQPAGYRSVRIGRDSSVPRFGYMGDAFPLYRALREIQPDVIYQRVACAYTGIAAHYARRQGARLIWHVAHDNDVMRDSKLEGNNFVRRMLERRSIEYGIRHADHIVVQSWDQARLLERNYGRTPVGVIPNFHPPATESLDKTGPLTVMWVANLKPWKQPEVFIRLAERLRDLPQARFVIVGAPPGAYLQGWYDSLRRSGAAAGNVEFLGELPQAQVNSLLASAHVFVNTSLHEGFPNTFIQAWMRDTAVVSLHVDPDDVLDREGVGIHAVSEDGLAQAVRVLLTDAPQRAALVTRARRHVLEHHSMRNALSLAQLIDTGEIRVHADAAVNQ